MTDSEARQDEAACGPDQSPSQSPDQSLGRATAVDRHVGLRIRERRITLGLSQHQMAQMIGVTYQQAHKYERGLNRISAGRLFEIAEVLNMPVSWFFEGLRPAGTAPEMPPRQRMCLELARNFAAIGDQRHQEALSQLARALAAPGDVPRDALGDAPGDTTPE